MTWRMCKLKYEVIFEIIPQIFARIRLKNLPEFLGRQLPPCPPPCLVCLWNVPTKSSRLGVAL